MRKALNIGCWSCFPSRDESMAWAALGVVFAGFAVAIISML